MTDDDDDLFEEPPLSAEALAFRAAREQLIPRLASSRIKYHDAEIPGEDGMILEFPNGRDTREVYFWTSEHIERLLKTSFEQYSFLGNYDGSVSYSAGVIECALRVLDTGRSPRTLFRILMGHMPQEDEPLSYEVPGGPSGLHLFIGTPSEDLQALNGARRIPPLALRITGVSVSQQDAAIHTLEQLAGALLFQLDLLTGIPVWLARRQAPRRLSPRARPSVPAALEFPKSEFDSAPLLLYWYARGAVGMPLLQFLAYYQVLEYYFPIYTRAEAQRRVQQVLKDPSFRADRTADIARIVNIAAPTGGSGPEERAQLRACINECVDPTELYGFVTASEERKKFFSSKAGGLTSRVLHLDSPSTDVRNEVADRLYEIRCKIVHTKNSPRDGEFELLLPFSKEAELLHDDINLMAYLATRVLIAGTSAMRLESGV